MSEAHFLLAVCNFSPSPGPPASHAPTSKKALGFESRASAHRAASLLTPADRLTHLGGKLFMLHVLSLGPGIAYRV